MPPVTRPSRSARRGLLVLALLGAAWTLPAVASANVADPTPPSSLEPTLVLGNKKCAELYPGTLEFKVDNDPVKGEHKSPAPPAGPGIVLTISDDRQWAKFTSDWGIDAVLVKGGENENAYAYEPPSNGDGWLRPPDNNGGNHPAISHVSFCYRPHGQFRIVKNAAPDSADDFGFTTGKQPNGSVIDPSFTLDDDADGTLSNTWESGWVAVGDYSVTEGTTPGWQLESISCAIDEPAEVAERGVADPPATISGATATISVTANETINCIYTNVPAPPEEKGSVRIRKLTDPTTSTATFDFVAGTAGVTTIEDLGHDDTSMAQEVGAGTYEFSETQLAGWDMTNVACDDADSSGSTDPPAGSTTEAGTVSFVVAPGEDVLCTVTNTQDKPKDPPPNETPPTVTSTPVVPVAGVAAAAQSLQQAPAPIRQVAASRRASPGSARLQAPSGCAGNPFTVRVRGSQIRSVVISVDGRRIRTLRGRSGSSVLSARIDPRKFRRGQVHRVSARVTFTTASGTRARTLRMAFQRCLQAQRPQFTG